jgi:MFS family permease
VVGAALLALPATEIVNRRGRRPSLAAGYFVAALGSIVIVMAATQGAILLLFGGFFLFGGAMAAGLQARYAAVDLTPAALRGRHLSVIVWATTLGAIVGPNLAAFAGASLDDYGIPTLAGPFVFSALLFGLAACVLMLLMRPDPAILARRAAAQSTENAPPQKPVGMRAALQAVASHPSARLGVTAMAVGHLVMIGVMAMTPVHIRSGGHEAAHTLRIVGVVLSLHIAGMYAFSPAIGWLTDRFGRRPVILAGNALLLTHVSSRSFGRDHGTGWCIGRRAVWRDRARVGISDAGAHRRARNNAVHCASDKKNSLVTSAAYVLIHGAAYGSSSRAIESPESG